MKEIQDHHPFHFLSSDISPFLTQRIKRKLVPRLHGAVEEIFHDTKKFSDSIVHLCLHKPK